MSGKCGATIRGKVSGARMTSSDKYSNCFVAQPTFKCNRIVAHGEDASEVRNQAKKKGFSN